MSRSARVLLAIVLILAGAATVYVDVDGYRRHARLLSDAHAVVARLDSMLAAINELSVTQRGYFESTPRSRTSATRVNALTTRLRLDLVSLHEAFGADGASYLAALSSGIDRFSTSDARVRANLDNAALYVAADLVLAASAPELRALTSSLDGLRKARLDATAAESTRLWRRVLWTTGGVGALLAIGLLTLASARTSLPVPSVEVADAPSPPTTLEATASACTAIARAGGLSEELLAGAAATISARGMVVWLGVGDSLVPGLGHGYDPGTLARIGTLPRDAENATAEAWRTGAMQVVPAGVGTTGAIVAPLVSQEGCIGVLSAEVTPGLEARPDIRASLALIAAQVASAATTWRPLPSSQGAEPGDSRPTADGGPSHH